MHFECKLNLKFDKKMIIKETIMTVLCITLCYFIEQVEI